jgi:predicted CopG family antitoxin
MKTITIQDSTWEKLTLLKMEKRKKNLDSIISELLEKKL